MIDNLLEQLRESNDTKAVFVIKIDSNSKVQSQYAGNLTQREAISALAIGVINFLSGGNDFNKAMRLMPYCVTEMIRILSHQLAKSEEVAK